ncbi:MAG: DNA/RNA nuclease SfsA [Bdellovibrio sp.]|nr:MAG: DNA/RNA nuclease SfsA [Bdellovibrio sp.]
MKWDKEIVEGRFIRRYQRFFAEVELGGQIVVAHVPNTGSLRSCVESERPALLSPSDRPERKLKFTLEALQDPAGAWVGVNTSRPNHWVREIFRQKLIPEWSSFDHFQGEVKINEKTRLDGMLLGPGGRKRYLEVKSVTWAEGTTAQFPDTVTERGQKHLLELMDLVARGFEAEIIFILQRGDCEIFQPAAQLDPRYAELFFQARSKGVGMRVIPVELSPQGYEFRCANEVEFLEEFRS